jgi:carbonic anhydrase
MKDIEKFISGFRKFQHKYFGEHESLFAQLKKQQSPKTMMIGCSDSRVDPAILTGCDPGDLFIVRNIANLVPPFENDSGHHGVSAAIEFAVCDLEVSRIIVLGHSGCGGIKALMHSHEPRSEADFVGHWMDIAEPAKRQVLSDIPHKTDDEKIRACEMASIIISLDNLMTFPFVSGAVESGRLSLIGWYFDIGSGVLYDFDQSTNGFVPIV